MEAVRNGALSVMVNSGVNEGMPFHANRELLTGWLKEELNWDGMIVTDWADINNLCTRDHIAASKKEAIKIAINAGIDMSMVPYEVSFCTCLKELVEEGEVPMSRIDDAVARVLRLKYRLGLLRTLIGISGNMTSSARKSLPKLLFRQQRSLRSCSRMRTMSFPLFRERKFC